MIPARLGSESRRCKLHAPVLRLQRKDSGVNHAQHHLSFLDGNLARFALCPVSGRNERRRERTLSICAFSACMVASAGRVGASMGARAKWAAARFSLQLFRPRGACAMRPVLFALLAVLSVALAISAPTDPFEEFVVRYQKRYASLEERQRAKLAFEANLARIPHLRSIGGGAEFGVTKFADMSASVRRPLHRRLSPRRAALV